MTASVLFVLGAGFSAPFDVPTMRPFLRSFEEMAKKKYPELVDTLQKHLSKLMDDSDIEALLTSLGSAESVINSLPPEMPVSEDLKQWEKESRFLKAHLVSYIIERCERFNRERAESVLEPLIRRLYQSSSIRETHLFTTNYDRIIEHVCESCGIDFSDGFDKPRRELAAPWTRAFDGKIRLYKLHGSVTYYVDKELENEPTFLRLDRGYPLPSPDYCLTREGHEIEPLMVLPTLEKEALGDPYGHLNHLFVETMSRTKIVIAIGTSLRDDHLVSAINYNTDNIVVLLVDTDPARARTRIPGVESITLKASTEDFLNVSTGRLVSLFESCVEERDRAEIIQEVNDFARREFEEISQSISMTEDQREALYAIRSDSNENDILRALQNLHGVANGRVIETVISKCHPSNSDVIRKAAVGCLGLSGSPAAVAALQAVATEDQSPDVRLEGYLALRNIGTKDAESALELAQSKWPEDKYL